MTPTLNQLHTQTNTVTNLKPTLVAPKLTPAPASTAKVEEFKTKTKPVRISRVPKTLADDDAQYIKNLIYGHTGTGKTFVIAALLRLGLKVLAVSTDFGGEGFDSVRNELKQSGEAHLLKNAYFFELADYDDVEDFISNPEGFWPDIYSKDIDVLVWDGASAFQQVHLDDKVLSFTADTNSTDARKAGLFAEMKDWGAIKRGTTYVFNHFLALHNTKTGRKWHKIVICHEGKLAEDKLTGEKKIGPLLQGAGAALIEPAFDLIFRTRKKRVDEGGKKFTKYYYEMEGTDSKILTKARGLRVNPTEPGDYGALWTSVCEQKGLVPDKVLA